MKLWPDIVVLIITHILVFLLGLWGFFIKDTIKRNRDKKERELESLKKLKDVIERVDRYAKELISVCGKNILIRDEEVVTYQNKYEQAFRDMEEIVIGCPENILSTIAEYKKLLHERIHSALDKQGRIGLEGVLRITISGLDIERLKVLKVIDGVIKKVNKVSDKRGISWNRIQL